MRKSVNRLISCITLLVFSLSGCSTEKTIEDKKIINNIKYSIDDYYLSSVDIEESFSLIRSVYYDSSSDSFDIFGLYDNYCAQVFEKRINDNYEIKKIEVSSDYSYEPYFYSDGKFYGTGLNSNGTQDNLFPDDTTIKSLYIDEEKNEYRLICMERSNSYAIDIRNEENESVYFENIMEIEGLKNFFEDSDCNILNDIKVLNDRIYISGYTIALQQNEKGYEPFIIVIKNGSFKIEDIITGFDIPAIDEILFNEDDNILSVYYDSVMDKTDVCELENNTMYSLESEINVLSYKKDSIIYDAGDNSVYKYVFRNNENIKLFDYADSNEQIGNSFVVNYSSDSYAYFEETNISQNVSYNCDSDGNIKKTDIESYYLEQDDQEYYVRSSKDNKKISLEFDCYTDINSMNYDENYFFLTDIDTLYVYNKNGELYFQKSFVTNEKIQCFYNNENIYVAYLDSDNKWNVGIVDCEEKKVSIFFVLDDYIKVEGYTNFINGNSADSFYVLNNGIVYEYQSEQKLEPLINISSCEINGDIKGFNCIKNNIIIISSFGITILKKIENSGTDKKEITIQLIDSDINIRLFDEFKKAHPEIKLTTIYSKSSDEEMIINTPDIIISNQYNDLIHLLKMDIFENLYTDDDLAEYISANCLSNIVQAYTDNDLLVAFPLGFYLQGLCMISDADIDENKFDFNSFEEIAVSDNIYINSITDSLLLDNNRMFIDYKNAKCFYDSQNFVKVLQLYKKCNDYQSENLLDEPTVSISSLKEKYSMKKYCFTGIPSTEGNDYYVCAEDLFLVSKKSENKKECFELLKFLLTLNAQEEMYSSECFPINCELYKQKMIELRFETDDEYADRINDIIEGNLIVYFPDRKVTQIILESLYEYKISEVSAEETAKNIQKKVKLYLSESIA